MKKVIRIIFAIAVVLFSYLIHAHLNHYKYLIKLEGFNYIEFDPEWDWIVFTNGAGLGCIGPRCSIDRIYIPINSIIVSSNGFSSWKKFSFLELDGTLSSYLASPRFEGYPQRTSLRIEKGRYFYYQSHSQDNIGCLISECDDMLTSDGYRREIEMRLIRSDDFILKEKDYIDSDSEGTWYSVNVTKTTPVYLVETDKDYFLFASTSELDSKQDSLEKRQIINASKIAISEFPSNLQSFTINDNYHPDVLLE